MAKKHKRFSIQINIVKRDIKIQRDQYSQKGYQNSKRYPFKFTKMIIK